MAEVRLLYEITAQNIKRGGLNFALRSELYARLTNTIVEESVWRWEDLT